MCVCVKVAGNFVLRNSESLWIREGSYCRNIAKIMHFLLILVAWGSIKRYFKKRFLTFASLGSKCMLIA